MALVPQYRVSCSNTVLVVDGMEDLVALVRVLVRNGEMPVTIEEAKWPPPTVTTVGKVA